MLVCNNKDVLEIYPYQLQMRRFVKTCFYELLLAENILNHTFPPKKQKTKQKQQNMEVVASAADGLFIVKASVFYLLQIYLACGYK